MHLPAEVLQQICIHLQLTGEQCWESQKKDRINLTTLCNLSLVNITWNRVAMETLYAVLDINNIDSHTFPLMGCNHITRSSVLPQIVCAMIARPSLGRHVRYVRLPQLKGSFHRPSDLARDRALFSKMLESAPKIGLPSSLRDRLARDLESGKVDAASLLLLSMCPNMVTLGLEVGRDFKDSLLFAVVSDFLSRSGRDAQQPSPTVLGSASFLTSITTLDLVYWDTELSVELGKFASLLQLPNLRNLNGNQLSCYGDIILPEISSRSIEEIYLGNSAMDSDGLKSLLTFCPNLRVLDLRFSEAGVGENEVDYAQLATILSRLSPKLQSLSIDDVDVINDEEIAPGLLGSLHGLLALTRLTVPLRALFETNVWGQVSSDVTQRSALANLPSSLEQLEIDDQDDGVATDTREDDMLLVEYLCNPRTNSLWQICLRRQLPFSLDISALGWSVVSTIQGTIVLARNGKAGADVAPLPLRDRVPQIADKQN